MSMKALEELKEMLCKELDEISAKGELTAGDLETVDKLSHSAKNIDKLIMSEQYGYSGDGDWEARGSYGRGSSYANRGQHYVRGHYSRDDGMMGGSSYRDGDNLYRSGRSRRGGYSYADGKQEILSQLEDMLNESTSERERNAYRSCISKIENA